MPRCPCGYETVRLHNFNRHTWGCLDSRKLLHDVQCLRAQVAKQAQTILEQAKLIEQKDECIRSLQNGTQAPTQGINVTCPQTTFNITSSAGSTISTSNHIHTTNRQSNSNVSNSVVLNLFGQESVSHVTSDRTSAILHGDPSKAIVDMAKEVHRAQGNLNVKCTSRKRGEYQIWDTDNNGNPAWMRSTKKQVLETMYDRNSIRLEEIVQENETDDGKKFLDFVDVINQSREGKDGGRDFKEQLERLNCVVMQLTEVIKNSGHAASRTS